MARAAHNAMLEWTHEEPTNALLRSCRLLLVETMHVNSYSYALGCVASFLHLEQSQLNALICSKPRTLKHACSRSCAALNASCAQVAASPGAQGVVGGTTPVKAKASISLHLAGAGSFCRGFALSQLRFSAQLIHHAFDCVTHYPLHAESKKSAPAASALWVWSP